MTRRLENRRRLDALKAVPCLDCGLSFPPEAMDFDHVRGKKEGNVSDMVGRPWPVLKVEVAKCDVVCATCHRRLLCFIPGFLLLN